MRHAETLTTPSQQPRRNHMLPICPGCGHPHDPRPCADEGSMCDCCAAMYADDQARADAANALDKAAS